MKKEDRIKKEMLELNFNPDSIGLVYWLDAIRYIKSKNFEYTMTGVYKYISKKRETSIGTVERLMRLALQPAKKKIQERYHYYGNIKVRTYLGLIRFKLI